MNVPNPKYRVGDVIVGYVHESGETIMFEIDRAYRDRKLFLWAYQNMDDDRIIYEPDIQKVYRTKELKK